MIKYCYMTFEEIPTDDHWRLTPVFGKLLSTETETYSGQSSKSGLHLNPSEVYQISMDQSSSNTGVFVKNYRNTEVYMIEILRDKGMDASDYIWEFELFMHSLCEGCIISHMIYERPIDNKSFRSAQVLFQLEGTIRQLPRRFPEFKATQLDCIENSSWRAAIEADNYKYLNRKDASMEAVRNLFPWSSNYGHSLYKDNDIYESIGVMMGWFACSFDHLGRPYMRGPSTASTVGGFVLPGVKAQELSDAFKEQGIQTVCLVENPKNPICKNLTAGVVKDTIYCVEFSTPYSMLALCVECNIRWEEPEVMTVVLLEASSATKELTRITGEKFHFVL